LLSFGPASRRGQTSAGQVGRYRVRAAGAYRVVYEIREDRLIVMVIRIGHPREVYRGL
jgi:mRNA interferase RelE/StbE